MSYLESLQGDTVPQDQQPVVEIPAEQPTLPVVPDTPAEPVQPETPVAEPATPELAAEVTVPPAVPDKPPVMIPLGAHIPVRKENQELKRKIKDLEDRLDSIAESTAQAEPDPLDVYVQTYSAQTGEDPDDVKIPYKVQKAHEDWLVKQYQARAQKEIKRTLQRQYEDAEDQFRSTLTEQRLGVGLDYATVVDNTHKYLTAEDEARILAAGAKGPELRYNIGLTKCVSSGDPLGQYFHKRYQEEMARRAEVPGGSARSASPAAPQSPESKKETPPPIKDILHEDVKKLVPSRAGFF